MPSDASRPLTPIRISVLHWLWIAHFSHVTSLAGRLGKPRYHPARNHHIYKFTMAKPLLPLRGEILYSLEDSPYKMSDFVDRPSRSQQPRNSNLPYDLSGSQQSRILPTRPERDPDGCFACRYRKKRCQKTAQNACVDCTKFGIFCEGMGQARPSVRCLALLTLFTLNIQPYLFIQTH